MQVVRKPHQIILIEHVFYPILVIIFIALGMTYGGKLALRLTDYQSETIGYAIATITVLLFFILSTILLPYSCARLWVSTNKNLAGFWYFFTKIYAGGLFIILVFYGISTLIELPEIIDKWVQVTGK